MEQKVSSDIKEIDFNDWKEFVDKHPNGTVFQAPEMYNLFLSSDNFSPVLIHAKSENKIIGVLLAVIIREYSGSIGFFSSRTVVYGGPLINSNTENNMVLDELLKVLINTVKNRSIFIQFRNFSDKSEDLKCFESNSFKFLDRLNYHVDTSSEKLVKTRLSKSKLRQIKKGLAQGAEIIDPENENQVREFYTILHNLYKFKVKKPLPDYSFFYNFYLQSKNKNLGVIKLVKFQDRIIGGILSPVFNKSTIYEWYVCGLDHDYKNMYPSVLATWAAIDYALKHDIKYFDFMGVGVPDKDYGVREFKAKFGGEMVNYGRFGRINNSFVYFITEMGYNILSLMRKI